MISEVDSSSSNAIAGAPGTRTALEELRSADARASGVFADASAGRGRMTSDVASSASKPFEGPPGTSTASGWRGGVFFDVDAFSLDGFACVPAGSD
ncbi:hypothetical protein [Corallococcus exercitus]|uniref:hypothetical protein n=1 Tax=Corallococcus exercitus TaxID=2316736 RepID=UPI001ABF6739|nr:hypothetical protein [Corallococcus exercitus]